MKSCYEKQLFFDGTYTVGLLVANLLCNCTVLLCHFRRTYNFVGDVAIQRISMQVSAEASYCAQLMMKYAIVGSVELQPLIDSKYIDDILFER